MPAGFQAFNSSGALTLEISDRVARILTVAAIGTTTTGSVAVPGIGDGTPVFGIANNPNNTKATPSLNVSGSNLNWDYGSTPAGERDPNLKVNVMVF